MAYQGWLAVSESGPGRGTMTVLPLLKETTAYWILRPFLPDVPEDLFPGALPGHSFHVSRRWHPLVHDALVPIPDVEPGTMVFWHPDLIHAVESRHGGKEPSAVFYIACGPDCAVNRSYSRKMRRAFLSGETPPDFTSTDDESKYRNRAGTGDVTAAGAEIMGFDGGGDAGTGDGAAA